MPRNLIVSLVLLFVGCCFAVRSADAGPISRNNPYRSFNISGVNYASTHWEKSHNKSSKSWSTSRKGGWFRRR